MVFSDTLNPRTSVRVDRRAGHGTVSVKRDVFRLWKRQGNRAPPQIRVDFDDGKREWFEFDAVQEVRLCNRHGALSSDQLLITVLSPLTVRV